MNEKQSLSWESSYRGGLVLILKVRDSFLAKPHLELVI